jgi:hypothetical protein
MITETKVKVYARFKGDIDGYQRAGLDESVISYDDWKEIYELLAGLSLSIRGLASPTFVKEIEARLAGQTSDKQTQDLMRSLASEGSF